MTKRSDYTLAVGGSMSKFEDMVKYLMSVGWQPQGGVFVNTTSFSTTYFQAMVR